MAEPRKPSNNRDKRVNSNVEKLKAEGKKFGGAEGQKQQQEADTNKIEKPEVKNVITGPVTNIPVKPLTDAELAAAKAKAEADLKTTKTATSNTEIKPTVGSPSKP